MRLTRHAACAAVLALGACGYVPPARLASISLAADADANARHATAIDIVFVYSKAAMEKMPTDAAQWFDKRDDLVKAQPTEMEVKPVKLAIGRSTTVTPPEHAGTLLGVYSYANYIPDGATYCNLSKFVHATIHLSSSGVACSQ
ncbi:MAG: hypothetical protein V4463_07590 [Pseudomonadota bacterium]